MTKNIVLIGYLLLPIICSAQMPEIFQTLQTDAGENSPLVADVNADGNMDLLVASENSGELGIWLGNGKMQFNFEQNLAVGDNPAALAAADFNGDDRIDLMVANHERQYLSLLLGQPGGRFSTIEQVELSIQPHPHVVAAADINADGHMDVVVDNRDQSGLVVVLGNGKAGFDSPGTNLAVHGKPYLGFALGDINGDGWIDVVTPNSHSISVMTNNKSTDFSLEQAINMPAVFSVGLADFDGDNKLDLIAASSQGAVQLYLGQGDGKFKLNNFGSVQLGEGAKLLITGDYDGDGVDEAVISNWNGGVHLLRFSAPKELTHEVLDQGEIINPWGLAGGDFDGDGRDEIVLTDGTGELLQIYSMRE